MCSSFMRSLDIQEERDLTMLGTVNLGFLEELSWGTVFDPMLIDKMVESTGHLDNEHLSHDVQQMGVGNGCHYTSNDVLDCVDVPFSFRNMFLCSGKMQSDLSSS